MRVDPSVALTGPLRSLLYLPGYSQHAKNVRPRAMAAHAAAQKILALQSLEKLFRAHSIAFGYPPDRLHSIVIERLKEHLSRPITSFLETELEPSQTFKKTRLIYAYNILNFRSLVRDWHGYLLKLVDDRQAIALLLEQLGDVPRALRTRVTIARAIYTSENAFGLSRLLRRSGFNERADKISFKSADETKLAEAWRTAFAKSTDSTSPVWSDSLRQMAEWPSITLQLALGFLRLGEGDRRAARRHFHKALVLRQEAKWLTIDGQSSLVVKYDPWSMGFAETFILAHCDQHPDGNSIFPPADALRLTRLNANFLRSEGPPLSALRFYGAMLYPTFGNIPPKSALYRNYWIAFYRDRWVAVPQSRILKWILPPVIASGYLPLVHASGRSKAIVRVKLILKNGLSVMHRLSQRLPFYSSVLKILVWLRHAIFRRFGAFFGVIFGSDLSTIKKQIDLRSS